MMAGSPLVPRSALAALAILAALLVLVRPICELWHAHAGATAEVHATIAVDAAPAGTGTPASLCCPYVVDTGAAVAMQAAWTGGTIDWQPPAFAPVMLAAVVLAFIARLTYWRRPLPRTPQSFYLRSARIRR